MIRTILISAATLCLLLLMVGCEDKAANTGGAGAPAKQGARPTPENLPDAPSEGLGMDSRNQPGGGG